MEGAGWHHINVVDGKRFAAYRAYLEPALARPNLTFETDALASRLLIEDGRCTGVEYLKGSRHHRAHATGTGQVIVSAGAIESPKLLLLSGHRRPGRAEGRRRRAGGATCPASAATSTTTC